jgi:pullulanase/glycogen debranching enzyme
VEAHDNQTLFDINVYAAPPLTSMADRVRMQIVGLSTVVLGQGVPFIHAGSELLRSKSLDRNSYNSGDWFNVLDFTFWRNNFGVGLPPAGSNQGDWSVMQPLLADPALAASKVYIDRSDRLFRELLRIRYSSRLFRLQTAEDIQARLAFLNTGPDQLPGLIVMTLSDALDPDIDPGIESIVVLVNANDEAQTFTAAELADKKMVLHPVQQGSVDPVVKTARYDRATGAFSVPARTTVVFVEYERPAVRIAHLIEEIQALVAGGSLTSGQGNSLIAKLESAIQSLAQGKNVAAVGKLLAFVNQVSAYIRTGKLSSELGLPLILTAKDIIWQILTGA